MHKYQKPQIYLRFGAVAAAAAAAGALWVLSWCSRMLSDTLLSVGPHEWVRLASEASPDTTIHKTKAWPIQ